MKFLTSSNGWVSSPPVQQEANLSRTSLSEKIEFAACPSKRRRYGCWSFKFPLRVKLPQSLYSSDNFFVTNSPGAINCTCRVLYLCPRQRSALAQSFPNPSLKSNIMYAIQLYRLHPSSEPTQHAKFTSSAQR